jgi:hypothetical protein
MIIAHGIVIKTFEQAFSSLLKRSLQPIKLPVNLQPLKPAIYI